MCTGTVWIAEAHVFVEAYLKSYTAACRNGENKPYLYWCTSEISRLRGLETYPHATVATLRAVEACCSSPREDAA
eukprot:6432879-Alexandrium_andersonii.AAC.1